MRHAVTLRDEPSFDKGEVTEKGSLNQRAMRANNANKIAELYDGNPETLTV